VKGNQPLGVSKGGAKSEKKEDGAKQEKEEKRKKQEQEQKDGQARFVRNQDILKQWRQDG
jgi:hypothetical protein